MSTIDHLVQQYAENPEAQTAIRLLRDTEQSVFLTGKAGTGKSTLLQRLLPVIGKKHVVLAPTGVAALNVGGQTIHSFFGLEPRPYLAKDNDLPKLDKKQKLLRNLELIIIDEISMVRVDVLNAIDLTLRKNLKSPYPFAGKQLLLIGDLFQLPPVVNTRKQSEVDLLRTNYATDYFFGAPGLKEGMELKRIELQKVYRQSDPVFLELLNSVRENRLDNEHYQLLKERYNPRYEPEGDTLELLLASTNRIADEKNERELNKLPGKAQSSKADMTGIFTEKGRHRQYPAEKMLVMKEGAQVIFIKNDLERRWVNGTLGKITNIGEETVSVELEKNGKTVTVDRVTWESFKYVWNKKENRIDKDIEGTFTQYPFKLAWAITIHKSQGQTFDKVTIDLGRGAFTTGQVYVALSRCRTLEGIVLKSPIKPRDIRVDAEVLAFHNVK